MLGDSSPFACLRRDDLWESLAKNPATRPYVADSGFQATIKKLQNGADDQAAAQAAMKDPRVMAAVAALQGWGLDVSEEDIKHAESVGDLKKRDPVQMGDLEEAHRHATVDAAKAAGNEFFKAQAHEQLKDLGAALKALRSAKAEAGAAAQRRPEEGAAAAAVKHMQRELARVQELHRLAQQQQQEKQAQAAREAQAEALRAAGRALPAAAPAAPTAASNGGGGASNGGAVSGAAAGPGKTVAAGYVAETDLSHWAAGWLERELKALKRLPEGGDRVTVVSKGLQRAQSEIHASVKQKRGKRALFYDLSLVLGWHAERAAGGGGGDSGASHEMDGIFRLYNVGQDTKYNPGGDKETSYMYELGFPRQHFGPSEPWAEAIKLAAADLFDLVAAVVERWGAELTAKATALAS